MGYTHYFGFDAYTKEDKQGWKKALPLIKAVTGKYKDIIQLDSDTKEAPVVDSKAVRFNGIDEDGHETFLILAEQCDKFCKTARKPYDLPVCEVLLILKALCPNFSLGSDGFSGYLKEQQDGVKVDGNWDQAMENVKEYGLAFHAEIEKRPDRQDGTPNPYCDFNIVFDGQAVEA